jgi:hypothetical protein
MANQEIPDNPPKSMDILYAGKTIKPEENYPPTEFCEENCKGRTYSSLKEYKETNQFLREHSEERYRRLFWYKIGMFRRFSCDRCPEAEKWSLELEIKKFLEEFRK